MDVVNRYKEIIESGRFTTVRYQNLRGMVTDLGIQFYDPDGEVVGVINPSEECLFGVFNDRFYDIIHEAVWALANSPGEYFD